MDADALARLSSIASQEWRSYVDPIASIDQRLISLMSDPLDPQTRQELYRQLFSGITAAYMGLFMADAAHPDFWPTFNLMHNFGSPNPDAIYHLAPIDEQGIYRIVGYRGTVLLANFSFCGGQFFTRGEGHFAPTYTNYDLGEHLHIDEKGAYSVLLSSVRPPGYGGDWLQIPAGSTVLMVRQYSYDWLNEVDGRFGIERLDTPVTRPRMSAQEIENNLRQLSRWAENWTKVTAHWPKQLEADGFTNKLVVRDLASVAGLNAEAQLYVEGRFQLEADEALIYEAEATQCRYWGIMLNNLNWSAIEYMSRQTSLNGHTAKLDNDGKFRAVISATDPGVPNWLDTAGYPEGTVIGRYLGYSSKPVATLTKVKLHTLRSCLPAETTTVSVEQREASLRMRRMAAQLRRRW